MVLFIILLSASAFFNKFTQHIEKGVKAFIAFVIVIAFLEWSTFEYWVFDPLLGLMINTMKVLFNAESLGLTEAIFGVDKHFDQLFSEIGEYTTLLEEKGAWYDVQIFKKIVAYLIIGMFGALYAIFTILIIVGFFGFMLLLGFAPVFMAIGIFNKGIFFSWLKTTMNYFLIPIFTAAVMSVTISFIQEASAAIENLSPTDSIFTKDVGFVFLVGIFSIGLHWKAPEFAAAITGGMASGAGSIVGTATAVGAYCLRCFLYKRNSNTHHSGGKNWNKKIIHGCFQPAKAEAAWNRLRTGGTK
jgi:type IV secretory pathway VirB6-like protein